MKKKSKQEKVEENVKEDLTTKDVKSPTPVNPVPPTEKTSNVEIVKTEDEKNGKGSVVLGTVVNGVVTPTNSALPGKINPIEKKVVVENTAVNKKKVTIVTPREKRMHTIMAIVVILALGFCGGAYYYFGVLHNPRNFMVKDITYNLGEHLSNNVNDYIDLSNVDELKYVLNISDVDITTIGDYYYTVTYQDIVKRGMIKVVDTLGPVLTLKENIMIKTNSAYKLEDFIVSCEDPSGCEYDFVEKPDVTVEGGHTVNILAKDSLGNESVTTVTYQVGSMTVSMVCTSPIVTNEALNTREFTTDTVYFNIADKTFNHISRRISNIFMRQEGYINFKNNNQSNPAYVFNDLNFSYYYDTEILESPNFINQDGAISYYESNGYKCDIAQTEEKNSD